VRVAADAMLVCDRAGTITFWNTAAEDLFGWSAAEAVGRTLDLIIPERFRERHWNGWHATMERGSSAYTERLLEVPALRRDGSTISIAASMTLLFDRRGAVEGIAAVIREDRSRAERAAR
jgi:PAS domain S-box-containing protein